MSSSANKCEVSKDKHEDQRKMEYIREVINSTKGRKGKSKPPIGGVYKDVEMNSQKQFDLLFYSLNRTTFSLKLERGFKLLELGNSLTATAAEAFITSCNDRNALTWIQNKGFLDDLSLFPTISFYNRLTSDSSQLPRDLWFFKSIRACWHGSGCLVDVTAICATLGRIINFLDSSDRAVRVVAAFKYAKRSSAV
ncbi:hypothetical protein F2Q69_00047537 [Brassica cretica]|uniref:Uncharacterized protein n=1 Tax=Brassica cretica TaxID=69181 RepID=A0A8S9Q4C9_BRACR|nr:hypothetical protein F2Q69_00047537 [Brassica cretica]